VKYALFKCSERDCGRYYVLEKPRKMYKRQTCCPQHRSWRSALRGTKEKRERERNAALEIAADALKEWPSLTARTRAKYHNSAKEYITDKVFRLSLSAKWVTRNLSEIEKRAKGELK
jgi:acyl-CoA reductase-like NAD-dependent aldehyde dehydrogenase